MTGTSYGILSLYAAETITNRTKRTLWRHLASGRLARAPDDASGRAMLPVVAVAPLAVIPMLRTDWELLIEADRGCAKAQAEVAVWLLALSRPAPAQYWLEQAAKQLNAEAMQWLALCALRGWGRPTHEQQAMVWLARAAALGHPIAQAQLAGLRPGSF